MDRFFGLRRAVVAGVCLLALLLGPPFTACAGAGVALAVFPVDNQSGGAVRAEDVRSQLVDSLTARGITVIGHDDLEAFMVRHRVRYAAGVDSATAEALRLETGAGGIVIVSLALSSEALPPKIAVVARLVSTESTPSVLWADDIAATGDDAPGLLDLRIVTDYDALLGKAVRGIVDSLVAYVQTGKTGGTPKRASKFRPKMAYAAHSLEAGKTYTVAVLPFLNLSPRRNAGDMLALLFVRHLSDFAVFRVLDTGVVRHELLSARIIMDQGPSITDAETVAALVEADFVLGGRVLSYQDFEGGSGVPHVEFSAVLIDRRSRKVVWSSDSDNHGTDGVHFFGRGRSGTAHIMATQMVRLTAEMIAAGAPNESAR